MAVDAARVKSLFLAASDLGDPAARAAFLERECDGDVELRNRVEALLQAHDAVPLPPVEATGSFAADAPDPDATGSFRLTTEAVGTIIAGRYKLLQQIGEGGMGTVWMADQTEPVKRRVAVKLIRVERGQSKTLLSRFEAERQAIALMDHPHIAKLLDAGTTETGAPYFVMELVKGVPLTEFCDAHKLRIPERLHLFMQICSAVQHAHQKGIIHRDLKPSNILVESHDGKPVPKVIDFGLAKATTGLKLTEHTLFTGFGSVLGTPLYMAPEQATFNAVDVDTRADIYALGVILYELLTGTTPLTREAIKQAQLDEMLRLIREQEAPTPSSRLSSSDSKPSVAANRQTVPAKLGRFVKGELDWIVLKALSKERERRYETANGFAKDIERFLNHEPVTAGPPGAGYKLRKFVQRHRGQVVAVSLVLVTLLAGMAGTMWQAIRAEQARAEEAAQRMIAVEQRTRAEKARDRTRAVLDAMTSEATGNSLSTQKEISVDQKKFLNEVLTYYREFAGEKADDEQSRARTAKAATRVGLIEYRLGRKEEGIAAFQMARDAYRTLAADFPAVPIYRYELANCHNNLGNLLSGLGQPAEAQEQYLQGLAIQEKLVTDFPNVPDYLRELALSHNNLGVLLINVEKQAAAEEQHRQALAIQTNLVAKFPTVPEYRQQLANSHNNLGFLLASLEKRAAAEEQYRAALALLAKLATEFPTVPAYRQYLAGSHGNLGLLLASVEKRTAAEEQFRQALAIQATLADEFPTVPAYRQELARTHNSLGILLETLKKTGAAEEQFRQALVIQAKLAEDFPTVLVYRQELATSHLNLGGLLTDLRKNLAAEEQLRRALAIQAKLVVDFPTVPSTRQQLALSHNNLGNLLVDLGQPAEAQKQYRQALDLQEQLVADFRTVPAYQIDLGSSYGNYGLLLSDGGRASDSLAWFDKAIALLTPIHRADPRAVSVKQYLSNSHWNRARAYQALSKHVEAIKDLDRVIALSPPSDHSELRAARATSRLQAGLVAEAVAEVDELTKSSQWNAGQWYDFACVYAVASGKIAGKRQAYADRAMELLRKAVGAGYKDAAHMKKDPDLDPLREREDFKKLVAEVEKKAKQP